MIEVDTDREFYLDHVRVSAMNVDKSVSEHLKLLKVPAEGCEQCLAAIKAVLRAYEPS